MLIQSDFKPAWWFCNAHMQTIAPLIIRRRLRVPTIEEVLVFPDDDFTELAWTERPETGSRKPIVIILHGLAGSKDSAYIKGMLRAVQREGWIGVLMHFRGCGRQKNNRASAYHSGETGDIRYFLQVLKERYPCVPLAAVGFSLGGNVLVKYLGEEQHNSHLVAGVSVSAPLDLADCSRRINQRLSKIYQKYLLMPLKQGMKEKQACFQDEYPLGKEEIKRIKTMWQFDHQITAPLFNFPDAETYYVQSSGKPFLKRIQTPCLMIHSADDPFMTKACIPEAHELSASVIFELSQRGGHLGFVAGDNLKNPVFWCETRVPEFLKHYLSG